MATMQKYIGQITDSTASLSQFPSVGTIWEEVAATGLLFATFYLGLLFC